MTIEYTRPILAPKLEKALFGPSPMAIIEWCAPHAAMRVETALAWLVEQAILGEAGDSFWWVSPDFGSTSVALSTLKSAIPPESFNQASAKIPSIMFPNATTLSFKAMDNRPSLYANKLSACVVDDAIRTREDHWQILNQTLINTRAKLRILSPVGGQSHWFNELARRAEKNQGNGDSRMSYSRITALDAQEAGLISPEEISYSRDTLPDYLFRASYLCEPYDDRLERAHNAQDPRTMTEEELRFVSGVSALPTDASYLPELEALANAQ